jgi:Domain of unknown function (DUF6457)
MVGSMDGNEWIVRFAERLGVEAPDPALIEELLDLAGDAAHSSERLAAPIACYLVGKAGIDAASARALAAGIA